MKKIFILLIILVFAGACDKESTDVNINPPPPPPPPVSDTLETETFTFLVDGTATDGKIFLPASYDTNINLPAIYLIDFAESHFEVAKDEFEEVVDGVRQIEEFEALSVTLKEHLNTNTQPAGFQSYYEIFNSMTSYIDSNYTNNTSRTFIGRGSEGGVVLMTLFLEDSETSVFDNFIVTDPPSSFMDAVIDMIINDDFPQNKLNKKLHFSFSTSNDQSKCIELINLINEAQYPWLQFKSIEYWNHDFENAYPIAFSDGLDFIFN